MSFFRPNGSALLARLGATDVFGVPSFGPDARIGVSVIKLSDGSAPSQLGSEGGASQGRVIEPTRMAVILVEPRVRPMVGDRMTVANWGQGQVVSAAAVNTALGALDHWRVTLGPFS